MPMEMPYLGDQVSNEKGWKYAPQYVKIYGSESDSHVFKYF